MKQRRNRTLTLLAAFTLAFSLAGCAGGNNGGNAGTDNKPTEGTATATKGTGEKTKLVYWTYQRHDAEYIKAKIDEYNKTNQDNIEVEMTMMAENYPQSLDLAFTSGQAPDVFATQKADEFYAKGYFEPLNAYMTDEMKANYEGFIKEGGNQFDDNIISLPNVGNTIRLVYNVDIFEKAGLQPPKSLDEMVAAAKKITEIGKADGIYGWSLPYKSPSSALSRSAEKIAELNGYHRSGFDFKTGKYDFAGWKPIIEAFRQMSADGSVLPGSEALDMDPMRAQFAEGKIGMYISYSTEAGVYQTQFPPKIRWDATMVPTIDGGEPQGAIDPIANTWLSMSSESKHKDAAWKFMSYMYGVEILRGYHEAGLGISVLPHVLEGAQEPSVPGIANFLPTKYDAAWPIAPTGITPEGKTWHEEFVKYILAGGDLDQVIGNLNDSYNAALDKAVADGKVKVTADPSFDPKALQK
ncbi:multiple sugar transport system substrate-binding protein [Paenibacillus phyllosphaerae]|uniref:Multiple sugar transport system substrate-binding protein n=1 Tax=Paenibacillus phyllosphaerae TaxID=274593 RepID=A0A7W5AZA0_9BACL|nr:extracellular solute-binding protein [Paenibacillus phyllosphaerae]MBB3111525.1 multiple sugar transport system substrate-binding protein [Paenibacillus phyllosphaerae]